MRFGERRYTSSDIFEARERKLPFQGFADKRALGFTGSRCKFALVGIKLIVESNGQGRHVRQNTTALKQPSSQRMRRSRSEHDLVLVVISEESDCGAPMGPSS